MYEHSKLIISFYFHFIDKRLELKVKQTTFTQENNKVIA